MNRQESIHHLLNMDISSNIDPIDQNSYLK